MYYHPNPQAKQAIAAVLARYYAWLREGRGGYRRTEVRP